MKARMRAQSERMLENNFNNALRVVARGVCFDPLPFFFPMPALLLALREPCCTAQAKHCSQGFCCVLQAGVEAPMCLPAVLDDIPFLNCAALEAQRPFGNVLSSRK